MKQLLLVMILLFYGSIIGFSQTRIGVSTSVFQSTLSGIRTDLPPGNGYSGAVYKTVDKTYGFGLSGLLQTPLYNFLELEYGLGYFYDSERIHFPFTDPFTFVTDTATLNIHRHYLQVPLNLNLNLQPKWMNNQFIIKGGLIPMLSISEKDNYQEVIFQEILLSPNKQNRILLNSNLSIGMRKELQKGTLEISVFQSLELTPFIKEGGWGFFKDLHTARNNQIGIQINYFFKTLKNK